MTKKRRQRKPEQIVTLLQEGEAILSAGKTLAVVYQKLEITESTWQRRKKLYGGMKSDEAKRLRDLEIENQKLKEMLADGARQSIMSRRPARCRSVGLVEHWTNL